MEAVVDVESVIFEAVVDVESVIFEAVVDVEVTTAFDNVVV